MVLASSILWFADMSLEVSEDYVNWRDAALVINAASGPEKLETKTPIGWTNKFYRLSSKH
jgi:hypothetical protein